VSGSSCVPTCDIQLGKVIGKWVPRFRITGTLSRSVSIGTSSRDSKVSSSSWSKTLSTSVTTAASFGLEYQGVGGSVSLEVSTTRGRSWGSSYSRELSMVRSESTKDTFSTTGIKQDYYLWQWVLETYNTCGRFVGTTETYERQATPSAAQSPCCLPGFHPAGAPIEICEGDGSLFKSKPHLTPNHCKERGSCADKSPYCPRWGWFCGRGWTYFDNHCPLTCKKCGSSI